MFSSFPLQIYFLPLCYRELHYVQGSIYYLILDNRKVGF